MDLEKLTEMCVPYLTGGSLRATPQLRGSAAIPTSTAGLLRRLKPLRNDTFEIISTGKIVSFEYLEKIVVLEQERIKYLSEIGESARFFFVLPEYDKSLLIWKDTPSDEIRKSLQTLYDIINNISESDFTKEKLQEIIMPEAEKLDNRGIMLWPMRAALSGQKASPGPFEIAEILGKGETLKRLSKAMESQ